MKEFWSGSEDVETRLDASAAVAVLEFTGRFLRGFFGLRFFLRSLEDLAGALDAGEAVGLDDADERVASFCCNS